MRPRKARRSTPRWPRSPRPRSKAAQAEGRREPLEAYAADGFLALVRAAAGGGGEATQSKARNTKIIAVVDLEALRRGWTEGDETCEIRGVGPVSVDAARRLLGDAALSIIIKDGVDVMNVTNVSRGVNCPPDTGAVIARPLEPFGAKASRHRMRPVSTELLDN